MPGGCGPVVLPTLRALTGAPVVFLTAWTEPADLAEYARVGAAGVIAKPFDPMTLSEELLHLGAAPR